MKSLDILNRVIQSYQKCFIIGSLEEADKLSCLEMVKIKQDLEVLETLLDNCENRFLSVLHECLIRGTPIHTEDIQRLSAYINKILTIKTMVGGE